MYLLVLLAASSLAWGQALDTPGRVARLSYVEGDVSFLAAGERYPTDRPNRSLIPGDRVTTDDGRAELGLGTAAIRLDERTELEVVDLDESTVRVELIAGTASLHLRDLLDDEIFEVVTPNSTIVFLAPGEYRVDVPNDGTTELSVRAGAAEVMSDGEPMRVTDGQRVLLEGRDARVSLADVGPTDEFDNWVLEREVQLADVEPPRYTPFEDDEYDELDRYGDWYDEPRYGRVWMPSYSYGYDPYHYGYWRHTGYGWSWYDPMPWSYYTFHYGRWTYLPDYSRWCWVPVRRDRPRYYGNDTPTFPRTPDVDARRRTDRRVTRPVTPEVSNGGERRRVVPTSELPRRVDADQRPGARPVAPVARDVRERRRVATTTEPPRRIDPEPRAAPRRDADSVQQRQRATPAPSSNREQKSAPQGRGPERRSETATARRERPAEARGEKPARVESSPKASVGTQQVP